jgi:antitoxin component of RelBE/YafQ-DinJ toxin-antitoxin module
MRDPTITFRVSQELYDKAKTKAQREDVTISQVLRRYLRQWGAEDEQPKEETTKQE